MKKIAFFSRLRLTNLHIKLFHKFKDEYDVIFIAYSDEEERLIRRDAAGADVINFKKIISEKLKNTKINRKILEEIDKTIKKSTSCRFCLNSSIQSDRSFKYLEYDEVLLLSQVYFEAWSEIVKKFNCIKLNKNKFFDVFLIVDQRVLVFY